MKPLEKAANDINVARSFAQFVSVVVSIPSSVDGHSVAKDCFCLGQRFKGYVLDVFVNLIFDGIPMMIGAKIYIVGTFFGCIKYLPNVQGF